MALLWRPLKGEAGRSMVVTPIRNGDPKGFSRFSMLNMRVQVSDLK